MSTSVLVLSIVEPPKLKLKALPDTLKYAFLGESEILPVIISSHLDKDQEEKLLDLLEKHKEAIRWTIADIKEISPSVVMHQIHFEENATPSRESQRHLNPVLKEVMRAEVMRLLDVSFTLSLIVSGLVQYKLYPKSSESQLLLIRIMSWFQLVFKLVGECT